jgi:hypothetical protein
MVNVILNLICCKMFLLMTLCRHPHDRIIDSTYTERFMGMPNLTDNYEGYEEGDLSNHVDQLKDKQFLLVSTEMRG